MVLPVLTAIVHTRAYDKHISICESTAQLINCGIVGGVVDAVVDGEMVRRAVCRVPWVCVRGDSDSVVSTHYPRKRKP
eukprot:scaffold15696_cov113-Isochrysis_galbana.AAC.6